MKVLALPRKRGTVPGRHWAADIHPAPPLTSLPCGIVRDRWKTETDPRGPGESGAA
jgi:hypothetical protein